MNEKQIDALLEKVRAELQQIDHVDKDERELLLDLEQDIHALLERTGAMPSILDRFQRAVERFEIRYPTLTTLLSEVSTILSNAGI